jgi:hypothetical protein
MSYKLRTPKKPDRQMVLVLRGESYWLVAAAAEARGQTPEAFALEALRRQCRTTSGERWTCRLVRPAARGGLSTPGHSNSGSGCEDARTRAVLTSPELTARLSSPANESLEQLATDLCLNEPQSAGSRLRRVRRHAGSSPQCAQRLGEGQPMLALLRRLLGRGLSSPCAARVLRARDRRAASKSSEL